MEQNSQGRPFLEMSLEQQSGQGQGEEDANVQEHEYMGTSKGLKEKKLKTSFSDEKKN